MALGQVLLDTLEVLNQELQLQPGEPDVVRGLTALNRAQDYFETLASRQPHFLGDADGTVTQTIGQEYTTFPAGVLRIDKLQYIDPTTNRPAWDLKKLDRVGGHARSSQWPWNILSTSLSGKPRGYYTNGSKIFWTPLASDLSVVRWYGFQVAADITASGAFAYPDQCILPIASFAARIIAEGVGDSGASLDALAQDIFSPVIDSMGNFKRDGAAGFDYRYSHDS